MDTITLCKLACSDKCLKKQFAGVYSSDTLPNKRNSFTSFIVNLDPKLLPGSHWVAIYFSKNTAHYFDSYGLSPRNSRIIKFMRRNSNEIKYNSHCFQDDFTITCGYFCLYFLYQSVRKRTLEDLHLKNKKHNEQFIKKFVRNRLQPAKCCHVIHNRKQICTALINMTHK